VLVVDSAMLAFDGHQSLLGPDDVLFFYLVQLLLRLSWQGSAQGSAKHPFAALPEFRALHLHEPFPRHTRIMVYSPECVEKEFPEVRARLLMVAPCIQWKGWPATFKSGSERSKP
jgi:hypothetical protein